MPVCCAPSAGEKAFVEEVFVLLNQHRQANGKPQLSYDAKLEAAVQGHCLHMAAHSFFDHDAPEEPVRTPWARATLCGTSASAENIALGQSTPKDVMASWTQSAGHNQNMLNERFSRVGIGYHDGYWGQLFD
jgi:uncharacterized protein YkwD